MYRYNHAPLLPLGLTFFVNGAAYTSLLPRLPQVADALALTPASLGLVLVGGGIGGLVGSFAAPLALVRFGSARVTAVAGLALAGGVVLLGLAPTPLLLAAGLALYGLLDGLHDTGMNDVAAAAQAERGRSLMGRLHAAWSGAGVVGAGLGAAAAAAGVPVALHLGVVAVVLVLAQALVVSRLWSVQVRHEEAAATGGRRVAAKAAAVLAVATVAAAVLEGGAMEWSALQLRDDLGAAPGLAGLAPTLFLAGMLLGRLVTDPVVDALGAALTARVSACVVGAAAALGLLGAAVTGEPVVALVGWTAAGAGVAPVFPLLFTAAGGSGGAGVVSGTSRLGFLATPPLIGSLGELTSLTAALALLPVAALALGLALPARLRPQAAVRAVPAAATV